MAKRLLFLILAIYWVLVPLQSFAVTDVLEVQTLQNLYRSLNSPVQLKHWNAKGGDPCEETWMGVQCVGSSLITLDLHGLELTGNLRIQLSNLKSLKHPILADNKFSGTIPYSIGKMKHLHHLNLSHNLLYGTLGDVFEGLENLKEMDLSFNYFTGSLPTSFRSLTNLTGLFLQNNQFTGSVIVLVNLSLTDLSIEYNYFTGLIPESFQHITNLRIEGNRFVTETNNGTQSFSTDIVPRENDIARTAAANLITIEAHPSQSIHGKKKLTHQIVIVIAAISLAVAISVPLISFRGQRRDKKRRRRAVNPNDPVSPDESVRYLSPNPDLAVTPTTSSIPPLVSTTSSDSTLIETIGPRVYMTTELQMATYNFSKENYIREGSLGSLYRADFADGMVVAVKNIKVPSFIIGDQQFLKVIKTIFNLKHPNIMRLLGYAMDQDQHLLVYEFTQNFSLDEALHSDTLKPLSYYARLQIALGIARALEYMHLSCVPPIFYSNLKASSILLDEELQPLLCDCDLAVFNNARMPGNAKADVYNFGELFLELLTGRKPFDSPSSWLSDIVDIVSLCTHVCWYTLNDHHITWLSISNTNKLFRFFLCQNAPQPEQELRPSMSKIVESLTHLVQRQTAESEEGIEALAGVTKFSYNQLVKATDNFNSECLIEDSRWWKVYKGTFAEGKVYAVKQLENTLLKRDDTRILEEVSKLQRWSHPNLVSIRGFCLHGGCRFIVSDLPPSTSLASMLYDAPESRRLGWKTRMFIALQIARGMNHLHDEGTFVKDLSATTIFVGDDMKTVISDVWISRVFYMPAPEECLCPSESYMKESDPYYSIEGYLPPGYIYPWTQEKDVYSFGILLLVLVSGKSPVDHDSETFDDLLITKVRPSIKLGKLVEAVDSKLGQVDPPVTEALDLVLRCTSSVEERRPSMAEVVDILDCLYKETIDDPIFSCGSN